MSTMTFEFKALTSQGVIEKGVTQAHSRDDAYRRVAAGGMTPVEIRLRRTSRLLSGSKIHLREVSQFTYQLSVLLEARIPISEGLRSIAQEESNHRFATVMNEIAASISAGSTITDAMSVHRAIFGHVYIETINAAEQSGNLVRTLQHLAEMLDREIEVRSSLRSALMYPVCVFITLALAVVFLLAFVVPRFARMFEQRGVDLPWPTQVVTAMSGFVVSYWWVCAGVMGLVWLAVRGIRHHPQGRIVLDRILHRIPVVRRVLQAAALARFAHVFGLSLASGLTLMDCLEMSGRASGRPVLLEDTRRMAAQVSQGGTLREVLPSCPYITGFARRLINAGEQSAEMPAMCKIIARHYDREVRYLTKNMATLIEPFVVITLAGVVLLLALSIFLPIWNSMSIM